MGIRDTVIHTNLMVSLDNKVLTGGDLSVVSGKLELELSVGECMKVSIDNVMEMYTNNIPPFGL